MYNAEKYIDHCLQTINAQTFKDFEVIVVDDCSTDRSVEIVEEFVKNNGGGDRFKLVKLPENSGMAAIPRNVGLRLARGIYVTFVDADDMIKPAALEILNSAAVKTDADVVHSEGFLVPSVVKGALYNVKYMSYQALPRVQTLTVETDNIAERVERFCKYGYHWNVWSKLFRRDFLIENRLEFVNARTVEDMIFVFDCVCRAKRYVRIPKAFYVYRLHNESITRSTLTLEQQVKRYVSSLVRGLKALDRSISRQKFFVENPKYKMMAIQFFLELHMSGEHQLYLQHPPHEIEPLIRAELEKESLDGAAIVTSYLLNVAAELRLRLIRAQNKSS